MITSNQNHPIKPIYDCNSKILILGSFPSVISRNECFYYANKNNRFWKVISELFNEDMPMSVNEKKNLLLDNNIALWDVIKSCDISGSKDNSISNAVPNDISDILNSSKINTVFCNGKTAQYFYDKLIYNLINIESIYLPSTSSANASYKYSDIFNSWKIILDYLK